ncbi:MAG: hypothetical protein ABIH26_03805 [Candidatus Eisenbacteria bacterium]
MRRRLFGASTEEDPNRSNRPGSPLATWIRFLLLLVGASMLVYALVLYVKVIHSHLPRSPLRPLLPGVFLLGVIWFLWGAFKEVRRIRRDGRR